MEQMTRLSDIIFAWSIAGLSDLIAEPPDLILVLTPSEDNGHGQDINAALEKEANER
jgi:hypothetical protein